jgi:hypothetical protein
MRTGLILTTAASVVAVSVGVLTAQHAVGIHPAPASHHPICAMPHAAGGDASVEGHGTRMSAMLGLTADQAAEIDRLSAEACASIEKYHEQILGVLTAEQRERMESLHGKQQHGSTLHEWMKKLHGGR